VRRIEIEGKPDYLEAIVLSIFNADPAIFAVTNKQKNEIRPQLLKA
jgi:hypothetical protein